MPGRPRAPRWSAPAIPAGTPGCRRRAPGSRRRPCGRPGRGRSASRDGHRSRAARRRCGRAGTGARGTWPALGGVVGEDHDVRRAVHRLLEAAEHRPQGGHAAAGEHDEAGAAHRDPSSSRIRSTTRSAAAVPAARPRAPTSRSCASPANTTTSSGIYAARVPTLQRLRRADRADDPERGPPGRPAARPGGIAHVQRAPFYPAASIIISRVNPRTSPRGDCRGLRGRVATGAGAPRGKPHASSRARPGPP